MIPMKFCTSQDSYVLCANFHCDYMNCLCYSDGNFFMEFRLWSKFNSGMDNMGPSPMNTSCVELFWRAIHMSVFYEIYSWGRTQNMLILHGQSCYYWLPGDARNHGILRIDLVCWEYSMPCTQRVNSHYTIIVRDWPFSKLLSVCVREDQHSKIQTYHEISRDLLAWSWL